MFINKVQLLSLRWPRRRLFLVRLAIRSAAGDRSERLRDQWLFPSMSNEITGFACSLIRTHLLLSRICGSRSDSFSPPSSAVCKVAVTAEHLPALFKCSVTFKVQNLIGPMYRHSEYRSGGRENLFLAQTFLGTARGTFAVSVYCDGISGIEMFPANRKWQQQKSEAKTRNGQRQPDFLNELVYGCALAWQSEEGDYSLCRHSAESLRVEWHFSSVFCAAGRDMRSASILTFDVIVLPEKFSDRARRFLSPPRQQNSSFSVTGNFAAVIQKSKARMLQLFGRDAERHPRNSVNHSKPHQRGAKRTLACRLSSGLTDSPTHTAAMSAHFRFSK